MGNGVGHKGCHVATIALSEHSNPSIYSIAGRTRSKKLELELGFHDMHYELDLRPVKTRSRNMQQRRTKARLYNAPGKKIQTSHSQQTTGSELSPKA